MEFTLEQSEEQARHLKVIQEAMGQLNIDYLEGALKEMKSNLEFRVSAMVMDPNPSTAIERADLQGAQLEQFRLYIEAAKNMKKIMDAKIKLGVARGNEEKLKRMFS